MALKRQHKTLSMFSMASMTDVIFLLLIFFMVTSTFVFPSALQVNLPQSSEQTAIKPSTRIYVDKDLNMYATQTTETGESDLLPIAPEQLEGFMQALKLCQDTNTPYSRMIEKGVTRIGRPMNDVLVAIENVGNMEIARLEKGFNWLATTAAGAPMIGFLGTVIGMVQAFFQLASAGNNSNVTILASGIYQALVTTVAGLIVGIIALFAYNYLTSRVNKVMNKLEGKTMEFMDLLNEPAK